MGYFRGSTKPLTNGTSWTSDVGFTERQDTVAGMVYSDKSGQLHIQQSADGVNWDIDTTYSVTAADGKGFSESLLAPYWRIVFTNDSGSDQTTFRISAHTISGGDS
jgi:hypothetical protein